MFKVSKGAVTKSFHHNNHILFSKGMGGSDESVIKEKIVAKIFFQIVLTEVLESCEKDIC